MYLFSHSKLKGIIKNVKFQAKFLKLITSLSLLKVKVKSASPETGELFTWQLSGLRAHCCFTGTKPILDVLGVADTLHVSHSYCYIYS